MWVPAPREVASHLGSPEAVRTQLQRDAATPHVSFHLSEGLVLSVHPKAPLHSYHHQAPAGMLQQVYI